MTPTPFLSPALPGVSHIQSGREGGNFSLFFIFLVPLKHTKAENLATPSPSKDGKESFLFLKQKRPLILAFAKGGRKSLRRTEKKSEGAKVS